MPTRVRSYIRHDAANIMKYVMGCNSFLGMHFPTGCGIRLYRFLIIAFLSTLSSLIIKKEN